MGTVGALSLLSLLLLTVGSHGTRRSPSLASLCLAVALWLPCMCSLLCMCASVAPVWINHVRGGLSVNPLPPCMGRSAAFAAPCCCQGGGARPLLFMFCACWPCVARRMPGFGLAVHCRFVILVVCAMRTRCGMRADWKERPGSQKWPIDCSPDAGSHAIVAARLIAMRLHDGAHDGGRAQVWRLFAPSRRNLEVSLGVLPAVAQRAHA